MKKVNNQEEDELLNRLIEQEDEDPQENEYRVVFLIQLLNRLIEQEDEDPPEDDLLNRLIEQEDERRS